MPELGALWRQSRCLKDGGTVAEEAKHGCTVINAKKNFVPMLWKLAKQVRNDRADVTQRWPREMESVRGWIHPADEVFF